MKIPDNFKKTYSEEHKNKIANNYGVSEGTVYRWARNRGLTNSRKIEIPDDLAETLSKMTQNDAAKHYGVSARTIQTWRKTKKLPPLVIKRDYIKTFKPECMHPEIKELIDAGLGTKDICEKLGMSLTTLVLLKHQTGLPVRPKIKSKDMPIDLLNDKNVSDEDIAKIYNVKPKTVNSWRRKLRRKNKK